MDDFRRHLADLSQLASARATGSAAQAFGNEADPDATGRGAT